MQYEISKTKNFVYFQIDTGKVQQKNGFFMDGGIHAREWISPATVMYMTGQVTDSN